MFGATLIYGGFWNKLLFPRAFVGNGGKQR
jgi:hypothetical protein